MCLQYFKWVENLRENILNKYNDYVHQIYNSNKTMDINLVLSQKLYESRYGFGRTKQISNSTKIVLITIWLTFKIIQNDYKLI